jgi:uncharacterized PurR-regulated membrane protein YhhQ (DUF165 family)
LNLLLFLLFDRLFIDLNRRFTTLLTRAFILLFFLATSIDLYTADSTCLAGMMAKLFYSPEDLSILQGFSPRISLLSISAYVLLAPSLTSPYPTSPWFV